MKRIRMETAVIWLLVIGPMLIGLGAAIWWGSGSKVVGLWTGFVPGAFVLIIAAALQAQIIVSKPEIVDSPKDNPLRAYVFTDMNEVIQTPAYDLTWRARFSVASIELEDQVAVNPDSSATKQILAQGGFLAYVFTFAEADWDPRFDGLLREEKAAIYGAGQIRYKDIDGKERYTDYLLKSGGRFGTKSGIAPGKFGIISVKSN